MRLIIVGLIVIAAFAIFSSGSDVSCTAGGVESVFTNCVPR